MVIWALEAGCIRIDPTAGMASLYTRTADRRKLARGAVHKLMEQ
jgi:hypothetical protein